MTHRRAKQALWRQIRFVAELGLDDLVVVAERRRGDQGLGVFDWLDDWLSPV